MSYEILEERQGDCSPGGRDVIEVIFVDGEKGYWFYNDNMTISQKVFSICENLDRPLSSVASAGIIREAEIDRRGMGTP